MRGVVLQNGLVRIVLLPRRRMRKEQLIGLEDLAQAVKTDVAVKVNILFLSKVFAGHTRPRFVLVDRRYTLPVSFAASSATAFPVSRAYSGLRCR